MTALEVCPDDDPEHDRYHRRSRALYVLVRLLKYPVLVCALVFVTTFPVGLWTGDWEVLRRSLVPLFIAVVCALTAKLLADVNRLLTRAELARLAVERFSVSGQVESFLRQHAAEEEDQ